MIEGTLSEKVELSGPALIKKLRESVAPAGKRASCLKDLSDAQLVEVYHRLRAGQTIKRIGELVQEEWGYHKSMFRQSIERSIKLFREKTLPPLLQSLAQQFQQDHKKREAAQKARDLDKERAKYHLEKLDALGRLRWAIDKQTLRCVKWDQFEQTTPIKEARADWKLLTEMCVEVLKIEMELGVRDRMPNEVILTHKQRFDAMIQNLPDNGEALIQAADKLLEDVEQYIVTLEVDDNGQYSLRKPTEADRVRSLALGICGGLSVKPDPERQPVKHGAEDLGLIDFELSNNGGSGD